MRRFAVSMIGLLFSTTASFAWWDEGHMQVAWLAYNKLTPATKQKVDTLLRLNPDYDKWVADAPAGEAGLYAFMRATLWADDIKLPSYGYRRDRADEPTSAQNIGYVDRNQHAYWHYKDIGWSPDGTATTPAEPVDAITQMTLFIAALKEGSGASNDVRSYDLVWILHLTGDLHQPLHSIARFTQEIPTGDRGGNEEKVVKATGETTSLHFYWDGIHGGYATTFGAAFDATQSKLDQVPVDPGKAAIVDPEVWLNESFELAKQYAYASPVGPGKGPYDLNRQYETDVRNVARSQLALAGVRLANLLNDALR